MKKYQLELRDIVNAYDYIQALMYQIPEDSKLRDSYKEVIEPLDKFVSMQITNKECPRCGRLLYHSDLIDYSYVCIHCDENFYNMEVK